MAKEKTKVKVIPAGCPACGGSGHVDGDKNNKFCPDCKGRGIQNTSEDATRPCPDCSGRGHVEQVGCFPCAHTGRLVTTGKEPPAPEETIATLRARVADLEAQLSAKSK